MQTDQAPAVPDTLALAQAYQDSIIAKRLPAWLKAAINRVRDGRQAAQRQQMRKLTLALLEPGGEP